MDDTLSILPSVAHTEFFHFHHLRRTVVPFDSCYNYFAVILQCQNSVNNCYIYIYVYLFISKTIIVVVLWHVDLSYVHEGSIKRPTIKLTYVTILHITYCISFTGNLKNCEGEGIALQEIQQIKHHLLRTGKCFPRATTKKQNKTQLTHVTAMEADNCCLKMANFRIIRVL
jgi:hypothetical protein